jgi:hypothetical protein
VIAASSISPYAAALIGAIGAIIGGLLTSGTTLLIESRRRRSEKQGHKQLEERELRQAIRLVLSELEEIDYAMRDLVRSTRVNRDKRLPAFAWAEHKSSSSASRSSRYRRRDGSCSSGAAPRRAQPGSSLTESRP